MKSAKKSLGQNFLIDKNIIKKIVNLTQIKNKNVIEIGPGKGALTEEIILRKPKSIKLIEKDYELYKDLKNKYSNNNNVTIFNADILKFDLEKILKRDCILYGNLPYNISSQILVKILKFKRLHTLQDLILMFQKELAEKILGFYPSKHYGRISILSNYKLNFKKKFNVSNNCFIPKPKIISTVIHFQPKAKNFKINNLEYLEKVTNILFSGKRKMINKNIKKLLNNNDIKKIPNFNLKLRPAEIRPEIYYKITEIYEKK